MEFFQRAGASYASKFGEVKTDGHLQWKELWQMLQW
jgi:hypothetical protein